MGGVKGIKAGEEKRWEREGERFVLPISIPGYASGSLLNFFGQVHTGFCAFSVCVTILFCSISFTDRSEVEIYIS